MQLLAVLAQLVLPHIDIKVHIIVYELLVYCVSRFSLNISATTILLSLVIRYPAQHVADMYHIRRCRFLKPTASVPH